MELAESVAIGGLDSEIKIKCPFPKEEVDGVDEEENEGLSQDDTDAAKSQQANNGGTLGQNLIDASPGKSGTVGGPFPPPETKSSPRKDTLRAGVWVIVLGVPGIDTDYYPFILAAHHLIPGVASLENSTLKNYMTQGKTVTANSTKGKVKRKISKHIGYNVNGAHNGVWLPGNYAIRRKASPTSETWSKLYESNRDWCTNYVASVSKVGGGQFHDAHTVYSEEVEKILNKMAGILATHVCEECNSDTINPPFLIKQRLYKLSTNLRTRLTCAPSSWTRPWFTSDKWRDIAFAKSGKPSPAFVAAYAEAVGEVLSEPVS